MQIIYFFNDVIERLQDLKLPILRRPEENICSKHRNTLFLIYLGLKKWEDHYPEIE